MSGRNAKKSVVKKRSVTFTKTKTVSTGIVKKYATKMRSAPGKTVDCGRRKRKKSVLGKFSAFRALAEPGQTVPVNTAARLRFPAEILDVNREYNPGTSTFRPRRNGVYSLAASVGFVTTSPINAILEIRVNGQDQISDFESFNTPTGIIDASGIIPLKAGDRVQVFATFTGSTDPIGIFPGSATRFEGARFR
ncbi:complement C1q domain-containing protein [Paenibacillus arenilitoris]|uniref:C1q domain-containing protein n=1 Tax=Paenibacillus arenilitoris TaxID=2772299 RepID=A0A927H5B4_9BACL|nr:hypothetical protein [Paenibacillus arenilitoris]MBD2867379.1 hypothetical protein [Paenibacillus arenilitoris]